MELRNLSVVATAMEMKSKNSGSSLSCIISMRLTVGVCRIWCRLRVEGHLLHRPVTQLEIRMVYLHHSDGSLEVLRDFLANEDTSLVKLDLQHCNFGGREATLQLFAAIQTKISLTDLTINTIAHLRGPTALGVCLNGLIQMTNLERLVLCFRRLDAETIRAFQQAFDKTAV
jgi:hypothetical protein